MKEINSPISYDILSYSLFVELHKKGMTYFLPLRQILKLCKF